MKWYSTQPSFSQVSLSQHGQDDVSFHCSSTRVCTVFKSIPRLILTPNRASSLVAATSKTITVTMTVTACAPSCYSTSVIDTSTSAESYTAPSPSSYPELSSLTQIYSSYTHVYTCSYTLPAPPAYTTEWSELPATSGHTHISSTRDACGWSRDSTSGVRSTSSKSYSETLSRGGSSPTYSTIQSTTTYPTSAYELPSSTTGYGYPFPSEESSVDATARSSPPSTLVTKTRGQTSSDGASRTDRSPPGYETSSEAPPSYDEPPSYTDPPAYETLNLRAVEGGL
jgi:hypothetical protein